jgi:hypothetical protein
MSSIIIPCDCGSEMIKVTNITDEADTEKIFTLNVYFLPGRKQNKLKLIWKILTRQVSFLYDLVITEKYMEKLSSAIIKELGK